MQLVATLLWRGRQERDGSVADRLPLIWHERYRRRMDEQVAIHSDDGGLIVEGAEADACLCI